MARRKTRATPKRLRAKKPGALRNLAAGLFTALLAPILVGVSLQGYQSNDSPARPPAIPVAASPQITAPAPTPAGARVQAPRREGDRFPILSAVAKRF